MKSKNKIRIKMKSGGGCETKKARLREEAELLKLCLKYRRRG